MLSKSSSLDGLASGLAGKKVFLTGATGHLGRHLLRALLSANADVVALVQSSSDGQDLAVAGRRPALIIGDIKDVAWQTEVPKGIQVVFHLAAAGVSPTDRNAGLLFEVNVRGTLNVLEAANACGVERFVHCGSCFEYGQGDAIAESAPLAPLSEYGASKAAAGLLVEAFFRKYGLPTVCLRPFLVYGFGDARSRLIPAVITRLLRGEDVNLSDGRQVLDPVYVTDVVEALLLAAAKRGVEGQTFNVASGKGFAVRDIALEIASLLGASADRLHFGAMSRRAEDADRLVGATGKAFDLLGWSARTTLREGILKSIESLRMPGAKL